MGGTRCVVVMAERKLVIDVVDNGGQWTHREWRMLRYLGVDTQIIDNTTPLAELRELDGLILYLCGFSWTRHSYFGHLRWSSIHGPALWRRC